MSSEAQRVVVIEDASRPVCPIAIERARRSLSLKAGDKILILRLLHQVTDPMGHKVKVDPDSMFGASQKMIKEEIARKKEEYINNEEIKQVLEECQAGKIEYEIEVQAARSPKVAVWKAARSFQATWVVLDRKMKKDKHFLFNKLKCGISRIRSDNRIEKMRGPKKTARPTTAAASQPGETGSSQAEVKLQGNTEEEHSSRKSPTPLEDGELRTSNGSADHPPDVQTKSSTTTSSSDDKAGSGNGALDNHPLDVQTQLTIANSSSNGKAGDSNDIPNQPSDTTFSSSHGKVGHSNGVPDQPLDVQMHSSIVISSSHDKAGISNGVSDHPLDMKTPSIIAYSSSNGKAGSSNGVLDHPLNKQTPSPIAYSSSNGKGGNSNGFLDHLLDVQAPPPVAYSSSNGIARSGNGVPDHPLDVQALSPTASSSSNGKVGNSNGVVDHPLDVQTPPTARSSSNGKARSSNGVPDHKLNMQTQSSIASFPSNDKAGSSNGIPDRVLDVQKQSSNAISSSSEQFVTTKCTTLRNAEASISSSTDIKCPHNYLQSEVIVIGSESETTREEWKITWEHSPKFPDIHKLKLARSFYEGQVQK